MLPDRLGAQLLAVCLFLFLHRFVSGGCTHWGQSCWGGHGKRSPAGSSDWYLSRLLMAQRAPSSMDDPRNIFGSENVIRGPVVAPSTLVGARIETNPEELESWEPTNDVEVPIVQSNDPVAKLRLYELLSG